MLVYVIVVLHLFFFWSLGKAVLRYCGIFWVHASSHIILVYAMDTNLFTVYIFQQPFPYDTILSRRQSGHVSCLYNSVMPEFLKWTIITKTCLYNFDPPPP